MSVGANRIVEVVLDDETVVYHSPDVRQEQAVAIYDLLEDNSFAPACGAGGPFRLFLAIEESRVVFEVCAEDGAPVDRFHLPTTPLRRVIKDYFIVCENYFDAIKRLSPSQIEAVDMGRRSLHDEGSAILRERLSRHAEVDHKTARRLFTLVCVLHARG